MFKLAADLTVSAVLHENKYFRFKRKSCLLEEKKRYKFICNTYKSFKSVQNKKFSFSILILALFTSYKNFRFAFFLSSIKVVMLLICLHILITDFQIL